MRIWGIADLHLSEAQPEGRDSYAVRWKDHVQKIRRNWEESVDRSDLVVLPGDISMAINHRSVQPDLEWLARLPGTKLISPGNHDRWWNDQNKVQSMFRPGQFALEGSAVEVAGVIVCGARGCSPEPDVPEIVVRRELASLDLALAQARAIRQPGQPLYVLWHYPPHDRRGRPGPVVDRLIEAQVTCCTFGHVHQLGQWSSLVLGMRDGIKYSCVAADAIGFRPLRLDTVAVTPRR